MVAVVDGGAVALVVVDDGFVVVVVVDVGVVVVVVGAGLTSMVLGIIGK